MQCRVVWRQVHADWTGEYELSRYQKDEAARRYWADVRVNCSRLAPLVRQALWGDVARSAWLGFDSGLNRSAQM